MAYLSILCLECEKKKRRIKPPGGRERLDQDLQTPLKCTSDSYTLKTNQQSEHACRRSQISLSTTHVRSPTFYIHFPFALLPSVFTPVTETPKPRLQQPGLHVSPAKTLRLRFLFIIFKPQSYLVALLLFSSPLPSNPEHAPPFARSSTHPTYLAF